MAQKIIMPKQGLQMTEGFLTQWFKKEGDYVKLGEPLFEMETDKLNISIDSTAEGTLLKILHPEGDTVPITQVLAYVGEKGEKLEVEDSPVAVAAVPVFQEVAPKAGEAEKPAITAQSSSGFSTPRAKLRAQERNVDIGLVPPTGPEGLVIERDVLACQATAASPLARKVAEQSGLSVAGMAGSGARGKVMAEDVRMALHSQQAAAPDEPLETVVPMDGMRSGIARHMRASLDTAAQANHSMWVDMSECVRLREQLKAAQVKVSFNDIVIRCTAKALREFPQINASREGENIIQKHYVNVGMAVATPRGLLVPVLRNADSKTLPELAAMTAEMGEKTKNGGITPDELTGGTFTVTNLGMLGVDKFTAILNAPESGILAVGAVKKQPVALPDDSVGIRPMMWLTLTYDHCVTDGAPAARFLGRIKELLENPALLL